MRAFVLAVAFLSASPLAHAQTWSFRTLAGTDRGGGSADGPAAEARFASPAGAAACADAIFIADAGNHAIRRLSRDGQVTTWAGALGQAGSADGQRLEARFRYPSGIAADAQCNLYVADRGNHVIRKISPSGAVTTIAGRAGTAGNADGDGGQARFNAPQDVAVDTDGTIWVADTGNNRVRRIGGNGRVQTINRQFNMPLGVAVDANGSAYVSDYLNHVVVRLGRDGSPAGNLASGSSLFPADVVFDAAGVAYVANYTDQLLQRVEPDGTLTTIAGTKAKTGSADGAGTAVLFDHPRGLAFDPVTGSVLVVDEFSCVIRSATRDGVVTTIAATPAAGPAHVDGVGSEARFMTAADVDVGANGIAYVADSDTIRRIARDGTTTTIAGTPGEPLQRDGSRDEARIRGASGIVVEPSGTLAIIDGDTVRRVALDGTVTTIAGSPTESGYRDGAGADARFNFLASIAVAPDGTIYVADAFNRAIRRIAGDMVTTLATGSQFTPPIGGMDVDGEGNVYVWNENVPSVFRITPAGEVKAIVTDPSLNIIVNGLALASDGTIYLGGFRYHTIFRVAPGSTMIERFAGDDLAIGNQNGPPSLARFRSPTRLDVAPDGRLFVRDGNRAIRVGTFSEPPRRRPGGRG